MTETSAVRGGESQVAARIAVVTGATGGIGSAICKQLAQDGYSIVAIYQTNSAAARSLEHALREAGHECRTLAVDLSSVAGISAVVDYVDLLVRTHPGYELRALVNNAALLLGPSFPDAKPSDFDEYFHVNVRAPFFLAQQLTQRMSTGSGVVNISSSSAHFSSPGDIVYAMSKAALESLTRNMAEAVADRGIRVNSVVPGFTDNGHPAFQDKAVREYMAGFSVLGDVAAPTTVADAVSFLLSKRASRTTGTSLDVSGGSTLSARGKHRADGVAALIRQPD